MDQKSPLGIKPAASKTTKWASFSFTYPFYTAKYLKWRQKHKEDELPRKLLATSARPGVTSPLFTFSFEAWEKNISKYFRLPEHCTHRHWHCDRKPRWEKMSRLKYHTLPWALLGNLKASLLQGNDYKILHRNGSTVRLTSSFREPAGPDIIWHFSIQTAMGKDLKWAVLFSCPCSALPYGLSLSSGGESTSSQHILHCIAEKVSHFLESHIDLPSGHRSILYGKVWQNSS